MLAVIIHLCEAAVVALIALLITRIIKLEAATYRPKIGNAAQSAAPEETFVDKIIVDRSQEKAFRYENKMAGLKLAQSFSGAQMMAVRKEYDRLEGDDLAWLRQAISLYLIGASDFIGKQNECAIKGRKEIIRMVLRSQLKLSSAASETYFDEAVHRQPLSDSDHLIRAGAKAAKMWLRSKQVPSELSLNNQLHEWGVFA